MKNNKKIGVVTFSNTLDNYGQILQYLATQTYLESRGHSVFLLNFDNCNLSLVYRFQRKIRKTIRRIFSKFQYKKLNDIKKSAEDLTLDCSIEIEKHLLFQKWAQQSKISNDENPRFFDKFREKYFHTLSCTYAELRGFYGFAVGSDQMWSYISQDNFLDFGSRKQKRFSIAPSVGHKIFSLDEIRRVTPLLAKFNFITVREQNGKEFCQLCGRKDAHIVLDPTFLITPTQYDNFADVQGMTMPKQYLLLYLLGGEIDIEIENIYKWAKINNLEVVYIASQGRDDNYRKCYATVEQWLALIKNAKYVFTNSFHGVALSSIYRIPFIVFPLIGIMQGMNGRILHYASEFDMNERIYKGDLDAVKNTIDWSRVENRIAKNICIMNDLLKTIDL